MVTFIDYDVDDNSFQLTLIHVYLAQFFLMISSLLCQAPKA